MQGVTGASTGMGEWEFEFFEPGSFGKDGKNTWRIPTVSAYGNGVGVVNDGVSVTNDDGL